MLYLYEKGIEILKEKSLKNKEFYWNNYDLVIWEKNSAGYYKVNGLFRNNCWGIKKVIPINKNGTWTLPAGYVKYFK